MDYAGPCNFHTPAHDMGHTVSAMAMVSIGLVVLHASPKWVAWIAWLCGYHQWSYDANFLLVCHRGPSGLSGGVQNGPNMVDWDMRWEKKAKPAAKIEKRVYHPQNLGGRNEQTTGQQEVVHSVGRQIWGRVFITSEIKLTILIPGKAEAAWSKLAGLWRDCDVWCERGKGSLSLGLAKSGKKDPSD